VMAGTSQQPARPITGGELMSVIETERTGEPFVLYRDDQQVLQICRMAVGGERLTIGRRSSNGIPLAWDKEVSRVHAALERIGDEWTISDDGLSKNGTFVNGERLGTRRRLVDGDTICVGASFLAFRHSPVDSTRESNAGTFGPTTEVVTVAELTSTQRRVLVALCRPFKDGRGFVAPATNQQVANEVFLSVDAVKTHLRALFQKFGVSDLPQNQKRLQLVERALLWGLVNERDL
jgi:pSer/pThr/pTyr-binding forkhead associated (FHA) protein